jgi:hypothetical protein
MPSRHVTRIGSTPFGPSLTSHGTPAAARRSGPEVTCRRDVRRVARTSTRTRIRGPRRAQQPRDLEHTVDVAGRDRRTTGPPEGGRRAGGAHRRTRCDPDRLAAAAPASSIRRSFLVHPTVGSPHVADQRVQAALAAHVSPPRPRDRQQHIAGYDAKIERYRAALDAGADPKPRPNAHAPSTSSPRPHPARRATYDT